MQLTGPPRLAGIVRDLVSSEGPITDRWDDRSRYVEARGRTRRKGRARLWPSWRFRLVVSAAEWLAWRSDLEGDAVGEFEWVPRTRRTGDPDWLAEHAYRARCTSDLPTLSDLSLTDAASGAGLYAVEVEIEGVEPYERRPDAVTGGYTLLSSL